MKKTIATLALAAACFAARAEWVYENFGNPFGQTDASVPFTATLASPTVQTPRLWYTWTVSTNLTNGVLTNLWVAAGNYTGSVGTNGDSFKFKATGASNTVSLDSLMTTPSTFAYTFSPLYLQLIGGSMQGTLSWLGTNGTIAVASLTTAQRLALNPSNGMIAYDATLNELMGYSGGAWSQLGGGTGAAPDGVTVVLNGNGQLAVAAAVTSSLATAAALASLSNSVVRTNGGSVGYIPQLVNGGVQWIPTNSLAGGSGLATNVDNATTSLNGSGQVTAAPALATAEAYTAAQIAASETFATAAVNAVKTNGVFTGATNAATGLPLADISVITTNIDMSVNIGSLPNLSKAISSNKAPRILFFGDSIGDYFLYPLASWLATYTTNLGVQQTGSWWNPNSDGPFPSNYPTVQGQFVANPAYFWNNTRIGNAGTNFLCGTNASLGGYFYSYGNYVQIWMEASASNGTAVLAYSPDSVHWTNLGTLNEAALGVEGHIVVTNFSIPSGNYILQLSVTAGTFAWIDDIGLSDTNSIVPILGDMHGPGHSLQDLYNMGTNLGIILSNFAPDLIVYEQTKGINTYPYWTNFAFYVTNCSSNSDVLIISSYCDPTDPPAAGSSATDNNYQRNILERAVAISNQWSFLDVYTPIGTWSNIVARGFNLDLGGDPHLNGYGRQFIGQIVLQKLNLSDVWQSAGRASVSTMSGDYIFYPSSLSNNAYVGSGIQFGFTADYLSAMTFNASDGNGGGDPSWRTGNDWSIGAFYGAGDGTITILNANSGIYFKPSSGVAAGYMWPSGGLSLMNMNTDGNKAVDPGGYGVLLVNTTTNFGNMQVGGNLTLSPSSYIGGNSVRIYPTGYANGDGFSFTTILSNNAGMRGLIGTVNTVNSNSAMFGFFENNADIPFIRGSNIVFYNLGGANFQPNITMALWADSGVSIGSTNGSGVIGDPGSNNLVVQGNVTAGRFAGLWNSGPGSNNADQLGVTNVHVFGTATAAQFVGGGSGLTGQVPGDSNAIVSLGNNVTNTFETVASAQTLSNNVTNQAAINAAAQITSATNALLAANNVFTSGNTFTSNLSLTNNGTFDLWWQVPANGYEATFNYFGGSAYWTLGIHSSMINWYDANNVSWMTVSNINDTVGFAGNVNVASNLNVTGTNTAAQFVGGGSGLTGLTPGQIGSQPTNKALTDFAALGTNYFMPTNLTPGSLASNLLYNFGSVQGWAAGGSGIATSGGRGTNTYLTNATTSGVTETNVTIVSGNGGGLTNLQYTFLTGAVWLNTVTNPTTYNITGPARLYITNSSTVLLVANGTTNTLIGTGTVSFPEKVEIDQIGTNYISSY